MAAPIPLPFEPVNITSLKAEFPHVNWNRWPHSRSYAYGTTYYRRVANDLCVETLPMNWFHRSLNDVFLRQTMKDLLENMVQPPETHNKWISCAAGYRHFSRIFRPRVVWALVVRNPWFHASDLQKICVAYYIDDAGGHSNVIESLLWTESPRHDDGRALYFKLDPFIYENPTISTAMARCGLRSPDANIRDLVAHAITKPPPCIGLVARFIEAALINVGICDAVAKLVTDCLYNPWEINDWNEDYMLMRVRNIDP